MLPTLAEIYDSHAREVFAFLLNVTRCEADARDVLQDVFVKIAECPELIRDVRDVRPWLIRTAHRQWIDSARRRERRVKTIHAAAEDAPLFAPAEDPDGETFRAAVEQTLSEIPAEQRAVIHLKIWEQMTFAQISEALGLSANTVASRYRYALDKLEGLLRPLHNEQQR